MPTNAMGREAANPGGPSGGGRSNADRDRDAARALSGSFGSRGTGGMSPALLDSKYSGARKRKSRQYEATFSNLARAGTILGSLVGGPVGTVVGGIPSAIDALSGDLSPLEPFEGRLPDLPSTGAGYAEGKDTDKNASYIPGKKRPTKRKSATPLGSYGKVLAGAGGTLTRGGL